MMKGGNVAQVEQLSTQKGSSLIPKPGKEEGEQQKQEGRREGKKEGGKGKKIKNDIRAFPLI